MTHATADARSASRARQIMTAIRRIVGMPDYDAYVAHLRDHHPECVLPTEREYYGLYLRGRYGGGFSRCC
jgi:uncharacterized short protein YbdD (DUF466 family)